MFNAYRTNIKRLNVKYKTIRYMKPKDFAMLNDNIVFLSNELNNKRYAKSNSPVAGTVIESGFMSWQWNNISHSLFKNSTKKFPYSKINRLTNSKKPKVLKDKDKMKLFFRLSNTKSFICFAGAGSGKTTGTVLSTIYANALSPTKPNLLITDPKGELAKSTFELLQNQGYNVRVLNILDEKNTDCFSPFTLIKEKLFDTTKFDINNNEMLNQKQSMLNEIDVELTDIIYSLDDNPNSSQKDIWDKSAYVAIYLIAWLIIDDLLWTYHEWVSQNIETKEEERKRYFDKLFIKFSFQSIFWTLGQFGEEGTSRYIQFYKEKYNIDLYNVNPTDIFNHPGILKWQQVFRENLNNSKSTFTKDVITNALKEVERFNSPLLKNMTIFNTFKLDDLYGNNDKPFALFVTINNSQQQTIPYITWFINYVLMKVNFYATQGGMTKLKKPLMCILEEIGNIGFIKNLPVTVNEGRGKNIFVSLFFQTHEQYLQKYGNDSGGFIRSCAYRLILNNAESPKFASELCKYAGKYKHLDKSKERYVEKDRVTETDIYSLPRFLAMIFMNDINVPYISGLVPWQLLGIEPLERLSIKIDDPNFTTSFEEVVYNPLNKIKLVSNKEQEETKKEKQGKKKSTEVNLNEQDEPSNKESNKLMELFDDNKTDKIDLSIYKESSLRTEEKLLCEILKINFGSIDVQRVKDILLKNKLIDEPLFNQKYGINEILCLFFKKTKSSLKQLNFDTAKLDVEIKEKMPERHLDFLKLKEFSILKEKVNATSYRQLSFEKYKAIKAAANMLQQIGSNQFKAAASLVSKTSPEALNFLISLPKDARFPNLFQLPSDRTKALMNLKNENIPNEIIELFNKIKE